MSKRISLTEMASILFVLQKGMEEGLDDMDLFFAPSECKVLVVRDFDRAVITALRAGGWKPTEFVDEVERRCSSKFAFDWFGWVGDVPDLRDYAAETLERR